MNFSEDSFDNTIAMLNQLNLIETFNSVFNCQPLEYSTHPDDEMDVPDCTYS